MKKILFIACLNFPPSNIVGALRPFRLAKKASEKGWTPVIVSFASSTNKNIDTTLLDELTDNTEIYHLGRDKKKYWYSFAKKKYNFLEKTIFTFISQPKTTGKKPSLFSIPWVLSMVYLINRRLDKEDYKNAVILTSSPPNTIHVVGLLLAKNKNIKWIADFRDPWDAYPRTGHYRPVETRSKYLENKIMHHASIVVSTTETASNNLIERYPDLDKHKFQTITNTFDVKKMDYNPQKNEEKFIISHTGIFYPEKDPYTIFRAVKTWLDSADEETVNKYLNKLSIHLIGTSDNKTHKIIEKLGLQNIVKFIDRVPHTEAIQLTKSSDLALISTGIDKKTRPGWLPSKLFEYLGCKIPILAITREGEMAQVIRRCNAGYVITSEDHNIIINILKNEIDIKFYGIKRDTIFTFDNIDQFEENIVFTKYMDILNNI